MTRFIFSLFVISFLLGVVGCSSGGMNPVMPTNPLVPGDNNNLQEEPREATSPMGMFGSSGESGYDPNIQITRDNEAGHYLLFLYECVYDPKTGEIDIAQDRSEQLHANVSSQVLPPNCADCLKMKVVNVDFPNKIYDVNVTLKNPTEITAYDVRGIPFIGNPADPRELLNADSYTTLHDDSNPADRNPFKMFNTDIAGHAFPGGTSGTVQFKLHFPAPSNFNIKFAIDISFPSNCKEPYQIEDPQVMGELDTSGNAQATVSCDVHDWQDNVEKVSLDISPLQDGLPGELQLNHQGEDNWSVILFNTFGAPEGTYELWISAKSQGPQLLLYNKVEVTVGPYQNHPPIWLGGIEGITGAIPGDGQVTVEYGIAFDIDAPMTYNIYVSTVAEIDFDTIHPLNTSDQSPYIVQDLVNDQEYFFAVRAMDGLGLEDGNTNVLSATPVFENLPPHWVDTVGITNVGSGPYQVSVWYGEAVDPQEPVTYNVYWDIPMIFNWDTAHVKTGNPGSPTIIDGLDDEVSYFFGVRAVDGLGAIEHNVVLLPGMPINLAPMWDEFPPGCQEAQAGDGEVTVIFGTATDPDSLGGDVTYNVYWSTEPFENEGDLLLGDSKLGIAGSPYVVKPLINGIPFYFVVRAADEFGKEEHNLTNQFAIPTNQPPVWGDTIGVQKLTPGNQQITVEYGTASDPDPPVTYNIYYNMTDQNFWETAYIIEGEPGSPSVITNLFNDIEVWVGVRAVDGEGAEEKNEVILSATPSYDNQPPVWDDTVGVQDVIGGDMYADVIYGTASDPDEPVRYNVYWSDTTPIDFLTANNQLDLDGSPTRIEPLPNGVEMYFAVRAVDNLGLEEENTVELPGGAVNQPPVWDDTVGIVDVQASDEYALVYFGPATDPSPPVTYNIYYDTSSPIDFDTASVLTGKTLSPVYVSGLTNGQQYWFAVRAEDSTGLEDTNTNELTATPEEQPPVWNDTIGIQEAVSDNHKVTVTYGTASDPDTPVTYNVYYQAGGMVDFDTSPKLEAQPGSPTEINGLTNGQEYYFAVRARDATGMEDTNTVQLPATPAYDNKPPTWDEFPPGIEDAQAGYKMVTVIYGTASDPDLPVLYNVYWSQTTPINFTTASKKIGELGSPTIVDDLTNGIPYYFAVRAMDGLGLEDTNTNERMAMPMNEPPVWDDTIGITGADPGDEQVTVSYGTASDPDVPVTYTVYYDTHSPINFLTALKIEGESGSPTVVDGLTNEIPYYFAVRARDSEGLEDDNIIELMAIPTNGNTPPVWDGPEGVQMVTPLSQACEVIYGTATDPDLPVTYRVYYNAGPIDWDSSPYITDTESPTTVPDLDNSLTYLFGVRAVDGLGLEDDNDVQWAASPNLPPEWDDTVGITGVEAMLGKATISFGTASDVDGVTYTVFYSKTTPINFNGALKVEHISGSPYVLEDLDKGEDYYFAVRAVDDLGLSEENVVEMGGHIWGDPHTKWFYAAGAAILSSPNRLDVNSDGKEEIIIGGQDGLLKALDPDDGTDVWSYPPSPGPNIDSSPCVLDINGGSALDVVYGDDDGDVTAVDGSDGSWIWDFTTGGAVASTPAAGDVDFDGDLDVAFGSADGNVYVVDVETGTETWSRPGGGAFESSPALYDVTGDNDLEVFIGSADGKMYCFYGDGSGEKWHYATSEPIVNSPVIGDTEGDGDKECVFVSTDGYLYVLDAATGGYRWNYDIGAPTLGSPTLGDVNEDGGVDIAIASTNGIVYLLNGKTHAALWSATMPMQCDSSAAFADLTGDGILDVVIGSNDGGLYCLDGVNGEIAIMITGFGAVVVAPLVYDIDDDGYLEIVYANNSGMIQALDTETPVPSAADMIWPQFRRTIDNRAVL